MEMDRQVMETRAHAMGLVSAGSVPGEAGGLSHNAGGLSHNIESREPSYVYIRRGVPCSG